MTTHFYPLMLAQHPEVMPYFNQTNQGNGTQPNALANGVVAYAANIDELGNSARRSRKSCRSMFAGSRPEQYPIVGACLLQAIARCWARGRHR